MAFNFYDTYGMPYEMLEETAERHGLKIDKGEFEKFLDKQRAQSRSKTKLKGEIFSETFAKKVEALGLRTEFLGYEKAHAEARVIAVLDGGEVILDRTPFYGESGGQAGDWGTIETKSAIFKVKDAKKIGDTIVHIGELSKGAIAKGDAAKASVDEAVRARVAANHTATHLLQAALRKVLGDHVKQTGSLVDSEHLRFDFTHIRKMEPRELNRVEEIVSENIKNAVAVKKEIKDIEAARKEGATALFGEKYDKTVRVVTVGDVSKELCGGTHVDNTSRIGSFKITSESSIASGVRRIEALTGRAAEVWLDEQKKLQDAKARAEEKKEALEKVMEKRIEEEAAKIDLFIGRARTFGDAKVVIENIGDISLEGLRTIADRIRQKELFSVAVLATVSDIKVSFVVSASDGLIKKGVSANAIAKEMAKCVEGSGGGRDNLAQGGGKAPSQLDSAVNKVLEILKEKLL
jgi:alanyl-tRNA synthetase